MSVYVAQVRSRSELVAVADLARLGLAAYTPLVHRWPLRNHPRDRLAWRHRLVRIERLTPGYVFVWSTDIAHDHGRILDARGVEGLLGGERPFVLRGGWLERVLLLQSLGAFDYTRERKPKLCVGELVQIVAGPFTGLVGALTAIGDGDNAKVRVRAQGKFAFGELVLTRDKVAPAAHAGH